MDEYLVRLNKLRTSDRTHRYRSLARFVLVSSLVATSYVGYFWYNHLFATPAGLYHRVWQAVKDYYYDKSALHDWDKFEHRYDHQIRNNDDAIKYANKMLSTFGDPYTALHSPAELAQFAASQSESYVGLGVSLATVAPVQDNTRYLAVVAVTPDGPARKAGVKPGDTILSVNGVESSGMTIFDFKQLVGRLENQSIEVVLKRNNRNVRLQLVPKVLLRKNVELLSSTDKPYAHIVVRDFLKTNTADRVIKLLEQTAHKRAIILDLRDNPGGTVDQCLKLAGAFLKDGKLVTLEVRSTGAGHHREIYSLKPDNLEVAVTDDNRKIVKVQKQPRLRPVAAVRPMIVLINGSTGSAAEMLAAALQDHHRARIVGTRSYGKGIAQAGMPMPNGTILNLTCVHYYTPSGRFIGMGKGGSNPAEGIVPDVEVKNARQSKESVDPQLARALELVACSEAR